jgi:hypothetical protein
MKKKRDWGGIIGMGILVFLIVGPLWGLLVFVPLLERFGFQ